MGHPMTAAIVAGVCLCVPWVAGAQDWHGILGGIAGRAANKAADKARLSPVSRPLSRVGEPQPGGGELVHCFAARLGGRPRSGRRRPGFCAATVQGLPE